MQNFVVLQNIAHFRRLLATSRSDAEKLPIAALLAKEEVKLLALSGDTPLPAADVRRRADATAGTPVQGWTGNKG